MHRHYRIDDDGLYESVRLSLDAAWGHVDPVTCVTRASVAPRDDQGRIVLSVREEFLSFEAVRQVLPGLISSGVVVEIDEATYFAATQLPDELA